MESPTGIEAATYQRTEEEDRSGNPQVKAAEIQPREGDILCPHITGTKKLPKAAGTLGMMNKNTMIAP